MKTPGIHVTGFTQGCEHLIITYHHDSTGCCLNSSPDNIQGTARGTSFLRRVNTYPARQWQMVSNVTNQARKRCIQAKKPVVNASGAYVEYGAVEGPVGPYQ